MINYQGKLTDTAGNPIEGSRSITFNIYDQQAGGAPIWTETQTIIIQRGIFTTQKGIFSTQIGATQDLSLPFDRPYYLGIQVGSDAEMTPRQPLSSTGYAFRAETAEYVEQSNIALLAQDSNKLNNKDGSFYLNRANHTGVIGYDDLDSSMQNLLNSGSKTVVGIAGEAGGNWRDLSNVTICLLGDKTVSVKVVITATHPQGTGMLWFELYINDSLVANPSAELKDNIEKIITFSGNANCGSGEVSIKLRSMGGGTQLKNGMITIDW